MLPSLVQWFSFVEWSTASEVASLTKTGKPSHVHLKIAASLHDFVQFGWAWMLKMVHETWKFSRVSSDTFLSRSWLSVFLIGSVPASTETLPHQVSVVCFACSCSHARHGMYSNKHIDVAQMAWAFLSYEQWYVTFTSMRGFPKWSYTHFFIHPKFTISNSDQHYYIIIIYSVCFFLFYLIDLIYFLI